MIPCSWVQALLKVHLSHALKIMPMEHVVAGDCDEGFMGFAPSRHTAQITSFKGCMLVLFLS